MEDLSKVTAAIRDLGVPIVMLLWFMFRMERKIEEVTKALTALTVSLGKRDE